MVSPMLHTLKIILFCLCVLLFSIQIHAEENTYTTENPSISLDNEDYDDLDMDVFEDDLFTQEEPNDKSNEGPGEELNGEIYDKFDANLEILDDNEEEVITDEQKQIKALLADFKFTYSQKFAYSPHDNDLFINRSEFRGEWDKLLSDQLFVKFDGEARVYFPKDHISEAEDEDLKLGGNLREFYAQLGFDSFSIKAGQQIIVWGETDGGIITDVVSPRDNTEFIFMDMEDSRLGQPMISGDYYSPAGEFQAFVNVSPRVNKNPEDNTRYDPGYFQDEDLRVSSNEPEFGDLETGLRWKKTLNKFELSMMAADLYMNEPVYKQETEKLILETYPEYVFIGTGSSYVASNFLFKLDLAYKHDYTLQYISETGLDTSKKNLVDSAFGVEYNANGKYLVSVELTNRTILDYTEDLAARDQNSTRLYALFNKAFLNDILEFETILYYQIQEQNAFQQFDLTWMVTDNLELNTDFTWFYVTDKESEMWEYRDEQRVGFEVKYYF